MAASVGAGGGDGVGGASGVGGAGGGDSECDPSIPTTGELPCPVFEVLKARCQECHQDPPVKGAPFPLLTFEDTRELLGTKPRWHFIKSDIESGYMPFNKSEDLKGDELKTMEEWFAQCAPPVPDGTGCEMK